jgi:UDP-N-acetylmuramoyl-L-alanyl-D-glutamate--2,6-diaminopimelate ligase
VLAGTVETRLAGQVRPATTTTPDPLSLQRMWREAAGLGVTGGSMEVSSHALDQHRVDGTCFEVAVFLNLTQDHLDYHGDMGTYAAAKAKLFAADAETGHQPRAVVHGDDESGRRLLHRGAKEPLTFGFGDEWDVRAEDLRFDARGSGCHLITPLGSWEQRLRVVGRYNVSNALAATAAALALGLPAAAIRDALAEATGAPGRLEPVDEGQSFALWVDYAHTPDALENVLAAARPLTRGKLIVVFGCGGDRDRGKRPLMGRIAVDRSDLALVTSDNPRTEEPQSILDDILAGIDASSRDHVLVEVDRRAAIGVAIARAEPGDVVVIAGKGHEDYQILGERKVHFDDREVAREWLRSHG